MHENSAPFAPARDIQSADDCYFYHSMTLPGHGEVRGEWDLRGRESEYIGGVDVAGKRVLEIGTASGHMGFWMEKQGAELVGYDLSDEQEWDIVPYHGYDYEEHISRRKSHIRKLNNSWWLARKCFNSRARVAYGSIYDLPSSLGMFDVVTLGSILLHLRDPFLAMQRAASLSRETLVVTDLLVVKHQAIPALLGQGRVVRFQPDGRLCRPYETWWSISPDYVAEVATILGFNDIRLSLHRQKFIPGRKHLDTRCNLYTIVARRGKSGSRPYKGISKARLAALACSRVLHQVGLTR